MLKNYLFFCFLFLFDNSNYLRQKNKNFNKIGDQIITNIDIENEYKYLISLNNDYKKLEKEKIFNFAKSSILKNRNNYKLF